MTHNERETKMWRLRARGRALIGASVAVAVVGVSTGAYIASADSDAGPLNGLKFGAAPTSVSARLASEYGVFRREVRAGDSLAKYLSPQGELESKVGVNPELARRIPTPAGMTTKVWLVPSADGGCLLRMGPGAIGPGGSCGPGMFDDPYQGADSSANLDGTIDVIGVVHDGVTEVTLVAQDGSERRIPVADNVYAAQDTKAPKEVHLVDPEAGPVTVGIAGYSSR